MKTEKVFMPACRGSFSCKVGTVLVVCALGSGIQEGVNARAG